MENYVYIYIYAHAQLLQLCPTLCDPMNCSLPGFSAHGILQARILGWVALPFSRVFYKPWEQTRAPIHICVHIYMYVCVCLWREREKKNYRNHITLCYASGYCSVIFKRKFPGLCFFSSVTADTGLSGYVEKNVTCSSVHGNFKSRKWRSQVNISRDPQGVSRSIKLFVHLYTVHNQHLLARGHRLSTFHMQQGKGLWQGGLSIGMHKLC